MSDTPELSADSPRRNFLGQMAAGAMGLAALAVPGLVGLVSFFNPWRRKSEAGQSIRVTTLDALPADGSPRRFPVIADRADAWNKLLQVPVGAVYVRRMGESKAEAIHVVCPHAGCYVEYDSKQGDFYCPCHAARFELDGQLKDPDSSPSPRPLDTLACEIKHGNEVWVAFVNYQTGTSEKKEA